MAHTHAGSNAITMLITLVKTALGGKVDKIEGYGLSKNDFSDTLKGKLDNIQAEANKTIVNNTLTSASTTEALSAAQGKALDAKITEISDSLDNLPYGDMAKETYDKDGDGVIDKSADSNQLGGKDASYYAPVSSVPTKVSQITNDSDYQSGTQVEAAITAKGYQTAQDVQNAIGAAVSSVYKPGGSKTFATLPTPAADVLGVVYNVSDAFTTTDAFVEGAGSKHPAGTNVVVVQAGDAYKFDALAGFVDLSGYVLSTDITELTNEQVTALWNSVTV